MPNIKSAIKRVAQDKVRMERNKGNRARMRTAVVAVERAIEEGRLDDAAKLFRNAQGVVNRVSSKGAIHGNKASRKISRLNQKLHKAVQAAAAGDE